jgi:choline dehydrogenase-like flavoprotein
MGNISNLLEDQPKDGYQYASILGVLVAPLSRGNVTLKSSDTSDLPIINPNWLGDTADQEVAIAMFKRIRAAFKSDAMAPVVIGKEYYPGQNVQSDGEILEFIKDNVMTLWHAGCTCKMGTYDDKMAVVDSQARVFGVEGLRVVDASAFPFLPPGHPQSTVCKFFLLPPGCGGNLNHRQICLPRKFLKLLLKAHKSDILGEWTWSSELDLCSFSLFFFF